MRSGGPKRDSLPQVHYGLYYGIVTNNVGPENLDRVKVRFPWLDGGDTDESHWAQIVAPMEGPKFGFYTLPDVDDVVAVMFIGGDFSQPVVLGGVWSKPDHSPEPNEDGKNNFRGYRSRAGARLIMDDGDNVKVTVVDSTGKNVLGIGKFAAGGAGPNKVNVHRPGMTGDSGVSISSVEGTFSVTCKNGTLKVTAKQAIKINAAEAIAVQSGQAMTLEGGATFAMSASSPTSLDAPTVKAI